MTAWVALLRAVNVGGSGKIEMARLRSVLGKAGLGAVQTYIASGNVVFTGPDKADEVCAVLADAIAAEFGGCPEVILRTGAELAAVATRNPFPGAPGNRVIVLFTDGPASAEGLRYQTDEQVVADGRELFVHYPIGQGQSRLVLPAAKHGTARNMNTVVKLAEMAANLL